MKRVALFLLTLALVAGFVGCGGVNPRTGFFNLTQDVWDVHIELSGTMTSDTSFQANLHAARTRDNCSGEAALRGELLHR
jgi:hypothetical protein